MMEPGAAEITHRSLNELTAEARHARDRFRLYRAKTYGPRLTSPERLRKLERASNMAQSMLRRARSKSGSSALCATPASARSAAAPTRS